MARNGCSGYVLNSPGSRRAGATKRKDKDLATPALSRAARRKPDTVSRHPTAEETLRIVLAGLDDMKAEDIVTINLDGKSSIADFMVVATGRSNRHVASIAEQVTKDLSQAHVARVRVEGLRQGDWVLIDAGDVVVHIFRPEVRDFYALEKMWSASRTDGKRAN